MWWDRGDGYWFVAGHDLVSRALEDHVHFSSRHDTPNGTSPYLGVMIPPGPLETPPLELDPPDHDTLRKLLRPRFAGAALKELKDKVGRLTDACLDKHIARGELDVYFGLAQEVCATTTLEMVGLAPGLAMVLADGAQVGATMSKKAEIAWGKLFEEIARTVEKNRGEPTDSIIGDLCKSPHDYDNGYIIRTAIIILMGGATSPVRLLLDIFRYLGRFPEERALLARQKSLLPAAVEEFMRLFTPTEIIARTATADTCLGDAEVKAGDRVVLGLAAANRDPLTFADPNALRLDRAQNPHVALGRGIHHCLGAALGRTMVATVLDRTLSRIPDFEVVTDPGGSRPAMTAMTIRF